MTEEQHSTGTDYDELLHDVSDDIRRGLEGLVGPASPSAVFSDPHQVGETLVLTAAAWERGGGFGFGAGKGHDPDGGRGSGGGGGGGAGSQGRPVAVIRVGPGGVEVHPIIDFTKIGVTILLSAVGVWSAIRRRH